MNDRIRTFKTQKAAQAKIDTCAGWDMRPVRLMLPDPDDPTKPKAQWAIEARWPGSSGDLMYLRESGSVR